MKAHGIGKQMALAYIIGVNESTISRWINDGPMSIENAISICAYLDISIDWFLTGKGSADQHKIDATKIADHDVDLTKAFHRAIHWMTDATKARLLAFLESVPSR